MFVGAGRGLTEVSTAALLQLLRGVYREELRCPLTVPELSRVGLQYCADELLGCLRGLDARAVQQLLVAVLAERGEGTRARRPASR